MLEQRHVLLLIQLNDHPNDYPADVHDAVEPYHDQDSIRYHGAAAAISRSA